METADVVIAGAGIIGLSLALDLASHGLSVTVLERGRAMAESSWAAAGMLAANDPENPPPLAALAHLSLALYPDYLALIEELSGRNVPLRTKAAIQAPTTITPPDMATPSATTANSLALNCKPSHLVLRFNTSTSCSSKNPALTPETSAPRFPLPPLPLELSLSKTRPSSP